MRTAPEDRSPSELRVGVEDEFEHVIDDDAVLDFARISGDLNPLHIDMAYAKNSNFEGRIVHGAYQIGLASAFLGMYLPGKRALLGSINAKFPAPLYYPARVRVHGEITAWNPSQRSGRLRIRVVDQAKKLITAEIVMGFTFYEQRTDEAESEPIERAAIEQDRAVVLVTGASGGIGGSIVERLSADHSVLAQFHQRPVTQRPHVYPLQADLTSQDWLESLDQALKGRSLYGVVHSAWPGMPRGGLLDASEEVVTSQLSFGAIQTVRLARCLFERVDEGGGRFIALSSIVGTRRPDFRVAAYSLGKATLEFTIRLLAPELARRNVLINAISPSFVPVGINKQATERQRKMEAAQVPLGRACESRDVADVVRFLLSPSASFIAGENLALSGGGL